MPDETPEDTGPRPDEGQQPDLPDELNQDDINALLSAAGEAAPPPPEPAEEPADDATLDQATIDAMLASEADSEPDSETDADAMLDQSNLDAVPADEEGGDDDAALDQSAIDALLGGGEESGGEADAKAGLEQQLAAALASDAEQAVDDASLSGATGADALLDQSAIDALLAGSGNAAKRSPPKPRAEPATPSSRPAPRALPGGGSQHVGELDLLAEVVLVVSAEIGRAEMSIEDVLKLRAGSLVELDKLAGEPVELFVNDRCIARGEVVVVDDSFGIRITELGPPRR